MPKVLLSVPHRSQQSDGDCLAACAAMVLAHQGIAPLDLQHRPCLGSGRHDENLLYVNDPAHPEAPVTVPRGDLNLAWLERDYFYALITP